MNITQRSMIIGGGIIGTITSTIGNSALRNGFKLIEVVYETYSSADGQDKQ